MFLVLFSEVRNERILNKLYEYEFTWIHKFNVFVIEFLKFVTETYYYDI